MVESESRKRTSTELEGDEIKIRDSKPKLVSVIAKATPAANENNKRLKLQSEVSSISAISHDIISNESPRPDSSRKTNELDPLSMQRNKRMFAGIMGHLTKAKERLVIDSTSIEKQTIINEAISKKQNDQSRKLADLRKKLKTFEIKKIEILKSISSAKNELERIVRYASDFERSQNYLRHFLVVHSTTSIFWLPNDHNVATKKLLQSRSKQVETAIAEREIEDNARKLPLQEKLNELQEELETLENDYKVSQSEINDKLEEQLGDAANETESTFVQEE